MRDGGLGCTSINELARHEYANNPDELANAFERTRNRTLHLAAPLSAEDQQVQSMADASPTRWHLAHTSWFFETFILKQFEPGWPGQDPAAAVLYNSYYNSIGKPALRAARGLISRPGHQAVLEYRKSIDERILELLSKPSRVPMEKIAPLIVLGINHEQQHQELVLTDIKHALFQNPLYPRSGLGLLSQRSQPRMGWVSFPACTATIGYQGTGFCFDNEQPVHRSLLAPFVLSTRPVLQGEWLDFIQDGGYHNPLLWLSEGWAWRQDAGVEAPLYWQHHEDQWKRFTLDGLKRLEADLPVRHINYFEADAYAHWAGKRLPTEQEWEHSMNALAGQGATERIGDAGENPQPVTGDGWEWTSSAYSAYPGYKPARGAVGEYNGKFMVNQMVLRGASPATPSGHSRNSYRNFFPPAAQWQFSGLRLAADDG
jgi:ergothioneine biosynthesis protein EgtB